MLRGVYRLRFSRGEAVSEPGVCEDLQQGADRVGSAVASDDHRSAAETDHGGGEDLHYGAAGEGYCFPEKGESPLFCGIAFGN